MTTRHTVWLAGCLALLALPAGLRAIENDPLDFGDLNTATPSRSGGAGAGDERTVTRTEGRTYSYDGQEPLSQISKRVYGDPMLWHLIYRQNRERLEPGSRTGIENGRLTLRIPNPPEKRVVTEGGKRRIRAIPGDTLMTIAERVYGNGNYWRGLWHANKRKLPDPENPFLLFRLTGESEKLLELPPEKDVRALSVAAGLDFGRLSAGGAPRAPESTADLPRTAESESRIAEARNPAGPSDTPSLTAGGSDASAYKRTTNPVAKLEIADASRIGEAEARAILLGTGMGKPNEPIAAGLKRLYKGYSYRNGGGVLDAQAKQRLFREYKLLRAALSRWHAYPDIGAKSTPQLVNGWVREACKKMTSIPEAKREKLLRSLMMQESSVRHWRDFRPVVGTSGDTGFGQFLPSTAKSTGINPYDPEQNVYGIAIFLNRLIRSKRGNLREALASYNGGGKPPASSYRYADQILRRAGLS